MIQKLMEAASSIDKKTVGFTVGISSIAGLLYGADPDLFIHHLSLTAQSQIAQTGFFFTVAAWIHASKVKKEIKESVGTMTASMTESMNRIADTLSKDLEQQSVRLGNVEKGVADLRTWRETLDLKK